MAKIQAPLSTVAHELGHAKNESRRGNLRSGLASLSYNAGRYKGIPGLVTGGLVAATGGKAAIPLAAVSLLRNAPLLREEHKANKNAMKGLKAAGYSPETIKSVRKNLRLVSANYGAHALGRMAAPLLAALPGGVAAPVLAGALATAVGTGVARKAAKAMQKSEGADSVTRAGTTKLRKAMGLNKTNVIFEDDHPMSDVYFSSKALKRMAAKVDSRNARAKRFPRLFKPSAYNKPPQSEGGTVLVNRVKIAVLTKIASRRARIAAFKKKWKVLSKGHAVQGGRFRGVGITRVLNKLTGEEGVWVNTHRARGKWRKSKADVPNSEIKQIRSTG